MSGHRHLIRLVVVITPCASLVLAAMPALAAFPITEYPVPTAGAVPEGAALGPDGNVWFTRADRAR